MDPSIAYDHTARNQATHTSFVSQHNHRVNTNSSLQGNKTGQQDRTHKNHHGQDIRHGIIRAYAIKQTGK